jgi:hypothetical protein
MPLHSPERACGVKRKYLFLLLRFTTSWGDVLDRGMVSLESEAVQGHLKPGSATTIYQQLPVVATVPRACRVTEISLLMSGTVREGETGVEVREFG